MDTAPTDAETNLLMDAIDNFLDEANYHGENHNAYWEGVSEGYRRAADYLKALLP